MAAIIIQSRRVWTRQPQGPVEVDWTHPLARGLIFAAIPGIPINLADSVPLLRVNTAFAEGVRQPGRVLTAGSYHYPIPANASSLGAKFDLPALTALLIAQQDASQNNNFALYRAQGSSTPPWGIGLHGGSYNGVRASFGSFAHTPGAATQQFSTLVPRTLVLRGDGSLATVYVDGNLYLSSAYTQPAYQYDNSNQRALRFGTLAPLPTTQQQIRPALGLIWNRPLLTDVEIPEVSVNPWQIFKPRIHRSFFLPSESADIILDASATGQAAAAGAAVLSALATLAGVGVAVSGGATGVTVGVPLTAAGIAIAGGSAGQTVTIGIAAAGLAEAAGAAGLSADVLLAGAGAARAVGNAALAVQLEVLAAGGAKASGTANPVGDLPGMLSASGSATASGQADIKVRIDLRATAAAEVGGVAQLTTTVTITAAGFVHAMGAGTWQAELPLAAFGNASSWGAGSATLYAPGDMPMQPAGMTVTIDRVLVMETSIEPRGNLRWG